MKPGDLTVEVRDRNLNRLGLILPSDLNLTAKLPWAGVGEWELTLPQEHEMVQHLSQPGSGIVVTGPTGPGTVGPIFSGPRLPATRKRDQKDPKGTLRFSGVTDEVLLEDSLAYPQPANADPATQTVANDTRTGYTESLMRQYVAYNACYTHAPAGRLVGLRTKLSLGGSDQSRGVTTAKSPRFQNLLELLQELAIEGTLGFRVIQVGAALQFQVVPVRDLRATIRLDLENGTVVSEEVQDSGPSLTLALVAGQGQGVDRTIITRARPAQSSEEGLWGRRIERFFDRRDTDNLLELQKKGDEELANTGPGVAIKLIPSDDQTMRYLIDWNVGDWVTAVVNGQETWSVVTEAIIQATPDFTGVGVSIGDVTSFTPEGRSQSRADKNDSRIGYLERASIDMPEGVPVGSVVEWYASDTPEKWLRLEGQAISRSEYSELYSLLGVTFGSGDGSTTFNLPDRRGRVAAGVSTADTEFNALGKKFGTKTHTLTTTEMPSHSHGTGVNGYYFHISGGNAGRTYHGTGGNRWVISSPTLDDISNIGITGATGGGGAHNNVQPTIAAHFIMKVK